MTLGTAKQTDTDLEQSHNINRPLPETAEKQDKHGLLKKSAKAAFLSTAPGLQLVEDRIKSRLVSDAASLSEIAHYLLSIGGKRIRPLLALLSARLFGMREPSPELIDAAAGIELIHMATLLHDDIIDQSPKRRNQTSALLKFGMAPTLLTGDFLQARAYGLCAQLDSFVVAETEKACVELSEGELLEGILESGRVITFEDYVTIVSKKTASLFALAGTVGSHLGGAGQDSVNMLMSFGRAAGIAFQMVDDILDVYADEDLLGKPAGTDLRQKTPSLVNVLWLQSGDTKATEFFREPKPTLEMCQSTVEYLRDSEILAQARVLAREFALKASSILMDVREPELDLSTREHLFAIVEYTLERCS